ncbi:MAG: hypothetical protein KDD02_26575 [Phaeodactylibacter sp.]|nr:hypothetical protein [Phaeodactylibacter sp.]MCB9302659.1 hypothetical protein [Lewinellaceae bacterium]
MPFINLPLPITTCETKGGSKYRLLDNGQAQRYINRFWGWDELPIHMLPEDVRVAFQGFLKQREQKNGDSKQ